MLVRCGDQWITAAEVTSKQHGGLISVAQRQKNSSWRTERRASAIMANITPNPTAGQFSGTLGDLVFARLSNGKVIVRHRPVRKTAKKPGETANQEGFIRAVAYARAVWNNQPELQAKYKAAGQRQHLRKVRAPFRTGHSRAAASRCSRSRRVLVYLPP